MKNNIGKYTFRIEWSEEDNSHIARCLEFPSQEILETGPQGACRKTQRACNPISRRGCFRQPIYLVKIVMWLNSTTAVLRHIQSGLTI